jgi:soluble lytic murein transglycosylase-like protein
MWPDTFERIRPHIEPLLGRETNIHNPLDNLLAGAWLYKQHLDATNGDVEQAAARYHGGLDERQWGPCTRAYSRAVAATYASFARSN